MKTLKLSTRLIGLSGLTTYHGYLSADQITHEDSINDDFKEGYIDFNNNYYYYHFDNVEYMKECVKAIDNSLPTLLDLFHEVGLNSIDQIDCVDYDSPKYYNFRGDDFHLDFKIDCLDTFNGEMLDYITKNGGFEDFLKSTYSSYDGFISFTPNNFKEWFKGLNNEDLERCLGAFFSYVIQLEDFAERFYYYVMEGAEMYYSEFVNYKPLEDCVNDILQGTFGCGSITGIDTEMEAHLLNKHLTLEFKQYYNLNPVEVNKIICDKYNIEFDFIPAIQKAYNEIDSLTLKMF